MGTAFLDIDGALIREMFHLPADTEIRSPTGGHRIQARVSSPDIPDHALRVTAIFRSQHGVSFFDRWEVTERYLAEPAAAATKPLEKDQER